MDEQPRNAPQPKRVELSSLRMGAALPARPTGALVDGQRRQVKYLRLSLTDRCNYRCRYCMPQDGMVFAPRREILTFEEAERLVRCFVQLGISRLRLTGGEPLVRRDVLALVERLASIEGVEDLAMTTNGHLLASLARPLREAGLRRLNISIDSLRADRFKDLTRRGSLAAVLEGIEAAVEAGFAPVKLNAVVVRGFNDDELGDLIEYGRQVGALVRFIEYMPIGLDGFWRDDTFVSTDEMVETLARDYDLGEATRETLGGGPARYYEVRRKSGGDAVRVGFISALSHNFCSTCNRVRVTARGELQECLAYPGTLSLRDMMRAGASDDEILATIEGALMLKGPGHRFDHGVPAIQAMSAVGG